MLKVLWEFYKEEANLSRQIASRDALNTYLLHSSYDKLCISVFFRINNFSYKYVLMRFVSANRFESRQREYRSKFMMIY